MRRTLRFTAIALLLVTLLPTNVHAQLRIHLPNFDELITAPDAEAQTTSSPSPSASSTTPATSGSPIPSASPSALPSPSAILPSILPSVLPSILPIGGEEMPSANPTSFPSPSNSPSSSPAPSESASVSPTPSATPIVTPRPTATPLPVIAQTNNVARSTYRRLVVPALSAVTMTDANEFYKDTALPNHTAMIMSILAVLSVVFGVSLLRGNTSFPSIRNLWNRRLFFAQRI